MIGFTATSGVQPVSGYQAGSSAKAGQPLFGRRDELPDPSPQQLSVLRDGKAPNAPDSVEFSILRNRKILNLRQWIPPGQKAEKLPKKAPVVLMVHSLSGRSAWMSPLVERLMAEQKGTRFYGLDIPAIGQHPYAEGHIRQGSDLVGQVREAIEYLGEKHDGPVVAIGLSLGGLLVSKVAVDPPGCLAGVSMISPGWKPAKRMSDPKIVANTVWGAVRRKTRGIVRREKTLPFSRPFAVNDKIKKNSRDPYEGLTPLQLQVELEKNRSQDRVEALTLKSFVEITKMMMGFWRDSRKIELPVRLFVTETDDIVDAQAMLHRYAKFNSKNGDKMCTVFGTGKHDLLVEGAALDAMSYSLNSWLKGMNRQA